MEASRDIISSALVEAGLEVTPDALTVIAQHLEMVMVANATMNLTSITDPRSAAWLHIVDSLFGAELVDHAIPGPICDLGAGAGFPGIPLGVVTKRKLTMVESTGKKAAFLQRVVDQLGMEASVLAMRAERAGSEQAGAFAVVTARALTALPSVVELAAPLLMDGGVLIAYKGTPDTKELLRGDRAASQVGLRKIEDVRVSLAGADAAARTLLVFERFRASKVSLPRRDGLAQHSPLA